MDLSQLRMPYNTLKNGLLESYVSKANPFLTIKEWINHAIEAKAPEPNTIFVSTVDSRMRPSCRPVLLKEIIETGESKGLVFYTNACSRKAAEMKENPYVAGTMYWPETHRTIRVEGTGWYFLK